MPAQSTFSVDEKTKVKAAVQGKILAGAFARVYYAHPDPAAWAYAGLQGALVIAKDNARAGALTLKMVDLGGTRGVIWEHECYDNFEYFQDRPYFHSFPGDVSEDSASLCNAADERAVVRRNA